MDIRTLILVVAYGIICFFALSCAGTIPTDTESVGEAPGSSWSTDLVPCNLQVLFAGDPTEWSLETAKRLDQYCHSVAQIAVMDELSTLVDKLKPNSGYLVHTQEQTATKAFELSSTLLRLNYPLDGWRHGPFPDLFNRGKLDRETANQFLLFAINHYLEKVPWEERPCDDFRTVFETLLDRTDAGTERTVSNICTRRMARDMVR